MNDDKKKLNHITLENTEINLNDIDTIYEQDIGEEYHIVVEEVHYEEAASIEDVVSSDNNTFQTASDNNARLVVEPVEIVEEKADDLSDKLVENSSATIFETNKPDEKITKEEFEEKSATKVATEDTLKSDGKIIKIAGIIAILLVIIVLILLATRKKVEKGYPVIKLVGEETLILDLDSEYKEMGYFALDQEDGDITSRVNVVGEVDTFKPGIYRVKYKVLDTDRMKTEVYRNIIVKSKSNNFDFNIIGKEIVFINPNADFIEEGYKAIYNGTDISNDVQVFGEVNRSVPGSYNLVYALSKDGEVTALKRTVVVYKGEEMDASADLITELNNWLIDEVHYSNKISLDNVSTSVLLYFGALNCRNDKYEIDNKELISCLEKILNVKEIKIPLSTKYQGSSAEVLYNRDKQMWIINKLELPRPKEDLFKVVVDNDTIYLYELYGYGVLLNNREICDGNDNKIYYSGVDRNQLLGYESCKLVQCESEDCQDNIVRTKNYKMALYVHTFKVSNGKYYWTTSEMIK